MIIINLIFVYFTMLRGFQRGLSWQKGFIFACFIQFLIEVLLYETMDCVWVHFVIPNSVIRDVLSTRESLICTIDNLVSNTQKDKIYFLDATRYFFVSTNLSHYYPDMIESMIIQSYHSYLPGVLSRKWLIGINNTSTASERFFRIFSITSLTTAMIQYVGSSPEVLQRVFIHSMQPLLLAGLLIMWLKIYHNPLYLSFLSVFGLYYVFKYLKGIFLKKATVKSISYVYPKAQQDSHRIESDSSNILSTNFEVESNRKVLLNSIVELNESYPDIKSINDSECKSSELSLFDDMEDWSESISNCSLRDSLGAVTSEDTDIDLGILSGTKMSPESKVA